MAIEKRHRVGKPRAIHLYLQSTRVRQRGDGRNLLGTIDGAELSGLSQRHDRRLHGMDVCGMLVKRSLEHLASQLPVLREQRNQLRSAGEELRCAAFVHTDVSLFVRVDRAPGRTRASQGSTSWPRFRWRRRRPAQGRRNIDPAPASNRSVQGSSPYAMARPWLASAIAARISGAAVAVLSLKKRKVQLPADQS